MADYIIMDIRNLIQAPVLPFVFSPFIVALLRRRHIVTHNTDQNPEYSDEDGKKEENGLEGVGGNEGFERLHLFVEVPGDTRDGGL